MLLGIILTILGGLLAIVVFILAEHKEYIWENIEFEEEGDTIERTREPNTNE